MNPRSCNIVCVPVTVPSVVRNLVALVVAVRRTRDVDDAGIVNIPAAFRRKKRPTMELMDRMYKQCCRHDESVDLRSPE
jgi:hypothetical protein